MRYYFTSIFIFIYSCLPLVAPLHDNVWLFSDGGQFSAGLSFTSEGEAIIVPVETDLDLFN